LKKEETFNQIVEENSERIRRICSYYNSNEQDQKDMFQEVLINVWKSLDKFRGESALSTWIYRIAVNTSLSYTGKTYKNLKLFIHADTQNLHSLISDDESLEQKLLEEENLAKIQDEIKFLSVIDNALISLMLEGLSMKEIADVIGITEPNVKVKIHRIKQQLKSKLGGGSNDTK
jgi:RNA polymerase sigma-70 factor (ECF subfamily)